MFKEIFNHTTADTLSSIALLIFVAVFLTITTWAVTRRKRTIDAWSNMPLNDDVPQDPHDQTTDIETQS